MNPREAAYVSLKRYAGEGKFLNIEADAAIKRYFSGAENALDRAFFTALLYGTEERRLTLDWYLAQICDRELGKLDSNVLIVLRLGLYQILYMDRVPESAAVNESVALAKRFAADASGAFVNAVLRRACAQKEKFTLPSHEKEPDLYLSVANSIPLRLCRELRADYGDSVKTLIPALAAQHAPSLRLVGISAAEAEKKLAAVGIKSAPCRLAPHGIDIFGSPLTAMDALSGQAFVQDEASQLCVAAVGAAAGETVLDACACPGGKAFGMAADMKSGRVVAGDIHKNKLTLITEGAARLGLGDVVSASQRDAGEPSAEELGHYDRVLCDAPCSGYGTIAKKPDVRYKSAESVERLPEVQLRVLSGSAKCVKPGGTLVYSTCTLLKRENEAVARAFAEANPDFSFENFCVGNKKSASGMLTLMPDKDGTDGFFIAKFIRKTLP